MWDGGVKASATCAKGAFLSYRLSVISVTGLSNRVETTLTRAWRKDRSHGRLHNMHAASLRLVSRRHVDYGRVRSAICPAC
ncbi:hypothetical protein GCM10022255_063170 [Dactylosporangium darangshiense]|uniref:Uncharacterized protein n=1 Tax=Dactylosporangium darangshiense TaxID=579108 RepID=A0ABP8DGB7_9ACTN